MRPLAIMTAFAASVLFANQSPEKSTILSSAYKAPSTVMTFIGCKGCGCRGGPGWRINKTGKCAGHKNLHRKCGNPPSPKRCTKEN